jgi:conjugal transfer pilus assembly protein TraW
MKRILLVVLLLCFDSQLLGARDLGVIGDVYEISEEDLAEMMKRIVRNKQESGEFDIWKNKLQDNVRSKAKRPKGVFLPRAQFHRIIEFDPSVTLERDIPDASGKILFAKGTKINPLDVRSWSRTWCFFDGDDEEQVLWVQSFCSSKLETKWIMVNGNVNAIAEANGRRVFFDQHGELRNKFQFQALPVVVRQGNGEKVLHVEEFPIN